MLDFIHCYYLYLYYWAVENDRKPGEQPFRPQGVLSLGLIVIPFQLLALLCLLQYLGIPLLDLLLPLQKIHLVESYKGPITVAVVLLWGGGIYLAYAICYRDLDYAEIPAKLQKYRLFSQRSFIRLFVLAMLNVVAFIFFLWLLTKDK